MLIIFFFYKITFFFNIIFDLVRDNKLRNEYSNIAINSYELCIRYDKKQWEVYYQLALQKAEMLEVEY